MRTMKDTGMVLAIFLLTLWPFLLPTNGQPLPRGIKMKTSQANAVNVPVQLDVVNLPAGQKFVMFFPPEYPDRVGDTDGKRAYITRDREPGENPQRYTYSKPGNSPGSWQVLFYIQEH